MLYAVLVPSKRPLVFLEEKGEVWGHFLERARALACNLSPPARLTGGASMPSRPGGFCFLEPTFPVSMLVDPYVYTVNAPFFVGIIC